MSALNRLVPFLPRSFNPNSLTIPTRAAATAFVRARPLAAVGIGLVLAGVVYVIGKAFKAALASSERPLSQGSGSPKEADKSNPVAQAALRRQREQQAALARQRDEEAKRAAEAKAAKEEPIKEDLKDPAKALGQLQADLVTSLKLMTVENARAVAAFVIEKTEGEETDTAVQTQWKAVRESLLALFENEATPPSPLTARRVSDEEKVPVVRFKDITSGLTENAQKVDVLQCIVGMLCPSDWLKIWRCNAVFSAALSVGLANPRCLEFVVPGYLQIFKERLPLSEQEQADMKRALKEIVVNASLVDLWRVQDILESLELQALSKEVASQVFDAAKAGGEGIDQLVLGPFTQYLEDEQLVTFLQNTHQYKPLETFTKRCLNEFIGHLKGRKDPELFIQILNQNFVDPHTAVLSSTKAKLSLQDRFVDAFIEVLGEDPSQALPDLLKEGKIPNSLLGLLLSGLARWQAGDASREISGLLQQWLVIKIFTASNERVALFHDPEGPFKEQEAKIACIEQAFGLLKKLRYQILLNLAEVQIEKEESPSSDKLTHLIKGGSVNKALLESFLKQRELLEEQTASEIQRATTTFMGQLAECKPYLSTFVKAVYSLMLLKEELASEKRAGEPKQYPEEERALQAICESLLEGPAQEAASLIRAQLEATSSS